LTRAGDIRDPVLASGPSQFAAIHRTELCKALGKPGDAEILQIVKLFGQSCKIADAVVVAVSKCLDVKLIDDRIVEPKPVALTFGAALMSATTFMARPLRDTAEQQHRILLLIDAQTNSAITRGRAVRP
jgi:hypothetical protein